MGAGRGGEGGLSTMYFPSLPANSFLAEELCGNFY